MEQKSKFNRLRFALVRLWLCFFAHGIFDQQLVIIRKSGSCLTIDVHVKSRGNCFTLFFLSLLFLVRRKGRDAEGTSKLLAGQILAGCRCGIQKSTELIKWIDKFVCCYVWKDVDSADGGDISSAPPKARRGQREAEECQINNKHTIIFTTFTEIVLIINIQGINLSRSEHRIMPVSRHKLTSNPFDSKHKLDQPR